jgi:hypothetical protein
MGVTLVPGISHRPGSSSENIIQPVVDATGLILRPFSNGQAAPVFQVQNVDGTDVHFGLTPDGEIELSGGTGTLGQVMTSGGVGNPVTWSTPATPDFSTVPILAPDSVSRNLIQPTSDGNNGLIIRSRSATQGAPLFSTQTAAGVSLVGMGDPLAGFSAFSIALPDGQVGVPMVVSTGLTDNPLHYAMAGFTAFDGSGNYYGEFHIEYDGSLVFFHPTSGSGEDERSGGIRHGMLDNTESTWKGRLFFTAFDSVGEKTFLTGEADGTEARISVLGAPAAPRQLLAMGAGHTVDDVIAVLQTFGWCKQS